MPTRFYPITARLARLLAVLGLTLGAIGISPLTQPAVAAPPVIPATRPASGLILPSPAPTMIVATTTIANDSQDGQCDLWEALQANVLAVINDNGSYHECIAVAGLPNVIAFAGPAAGATIQVPASINSGDLPFIHGDLTLLGPITIKPSATLTDTHLFRTAGDATFTLIAVTLTGAHTGGSGAAILDINHATINAIGSNFTNNTADNTGGAIDSDGNVNVSLSNFSGNLASGANGQDGNGGAIWIVGAGNLTVAKSSFAGNTAHAGGGAIYSTNSNATVSDSLFTGNVAGQDNALLKGGGAIYNDVGGALGIARTQFVANLTPQGNGGALFNNSGANLVISDTTFAANAAGDLSHVEYGGAVYNQASVLIERSSFATNIAPQGHGGALAVDRAGTATVANSTFAANAAPNGLGAAIIVTQTQQGGPASSLIARNITLSKNGTPAQNDTGLYNALGQNADLGNTIIADNINANCAGAGNFVSSGHNLASDNTCHFTGPGDLPNDSSANLGGPSFNGGPLASMLTMKLQAGSHAIDAGDNALCNVAPVNKEDQRGEERPKDGSHFGTNYCDIGAYEADAPTPSYASDPSEPGPIDLGSTTINTTITTTLAISNTGEWPLNISQIALTGSNPGEFHVDAVPLVIVQHAGPTYLVITCHPTVAQSRTALLGYVTDDVPLHAVVGYLLKCQGTAAATPSYASSPIAPGPISFPNTLVGSNSIRTFQVSENGNSQLNVDSAVLSGPDQAQFSLQTSFPFNIPDGGGPHTVTVECSPTGPGLHAATLTLSTNDGGQTHFAYSLTCTGTLPPSPFLVAGAPVGNSPAHGLNGAYGLAVAPDGHNVYVTGFGDDDVASFKRDLGSGALTFVAHNGAFFNYLDGARLIALSSDNKNGYAVGSLASALVQGIRDPLTGEMTFPHGYQPPELNGAYGVAVSPDGRNVYVSTSVSRTVVFSRNPANGDLTTPPLQTIVSADLAGARGLAVSPDGANVYVTAYAATNTGKLVVYKRSAVDGTLTHVQTRTQGDCIDSILCFGHLDGLKGAFQVAVSPDGQNVYVAGTYSGALLAFRRDSLDGSVHILGGYFDNVGGVNGLDGISGVDVTPDGLHVVASGYNDKAVAVFDRDLISGLLTFNQMLQRNPFSGGSPSLPLDGAREIRVSPDGQNVYVASFVDSAVSVLGAARPVPLIDNINPAGVALNAANVMMTINGDNFVLGAIVKVGVVNEPATFLSSHKLQVDVSAYVHSSGVTQIRVFNPSPGGGLSNAVDFTVAQPAQNPVPSIDHINPQAGLAGGSAITLDVFGASFINGSVVRWNGNNRITTYVNSTHLQASLPQSDVSQPGTSSVSVVTADPGGGVSNDVAFTVAQPGQNPIASLSSLNPPWLFSQGAASKQLVVTITGQNFIPSSVAQFDGANRPTDVVDASHVRVTIYASDLVAPNSVALTAFTPGPGGGTSNALTLSIRQLHRLVFSLIMK